MNVMNIEEENEVLSQIAAGAYKSVENLDSLKDKYKTYAQNTLKKDKRINIRINERDLIALQKKALSEGIPYQTFISSLLHKYINGSLVENKA